MPADRFNRTLGMLECTLFMLFCSACALRTGPADARLRSSTVPLAIPFDSWPARTTDVGNDELPPGCRPVGRGYFTDDPAAISANPSMFQIDDVRQCGVAVLIAPSRPTHLPRVVCIPMELPPSQSSSRGLVIAFSSITPAASDEYERSLLDTLASRGWATARIRTMVPPMRAESTLAPQNEAELASMAVSIANDADEGWADNAYAAEILLEVLHQRAPGIEPPRVLLVGFSAGAIASCITAASIHDSVAGAILIGGGANLLQVALKTNIVEHRATLKPLPGMSRDTTRWLLEQKYLASSRLDPHATARYLSDKPVLQIHAAFDGAVPASTGKLLNDRLRDAAMWTYPCGHQRLFGVVKHDAVEDAEWVDKNL